MLTKAISRNLDRVFNDYNLQGPVIPYTVECNNDVGLSDEFSIKLGDFYLWKDNEGNIAKEINFKRRENESESDFDIRTNDEFWSYELYVNLENLFDDDGCFIGDYNNDTLVCDDGYLSNYISSAINKHLESNPKNYAYDSDILRCYQSWWMERRLDPALRGDGF